jgi:uncharacterized protein (DUF983 family)
MSTELVIQADGFSLCCPHCGDELTSIVINRLYDLEQTCDSCWESYTLSLSVEPQ